jgi:4-hydroxy-2-oxoheptanedioate aldolase
LLLITHFFAHNSTQHLTTHFQKKSLNMDRFRALSLFQPSNLNGAIGAADYEGSHERPEHIFGCMLGIPHTQMARLVAVLGFDFIFVDTLHV